MTEQFHTDAHTLNRKMQIILITVGLVSAIVIAIRLAGNTPAIPGVLESGRSVRDMTSRDVNVPADARRILSLCTSATDTIVAMGEADRLVAIDEYNTPVAGVEHAAVIGKGSAISKEQVLALKIDLAFIWWYQDDSADMLERLGVPVVRISSQRAWQVPETIRLIGDCLGRPDKAGPLAARVESFLERAPSQTAPTARVSTYIELYSPFRTVGGDSYMNDLIDLAGGVNIAAQATGTVILSPERLIQHEPDVILIVDGFGDKRSLSARPGMTGLKAVRNGRVHVIDRDILIAGPSLPRAVEKLKKTLADQGEPER